MEDPIILTLKLDEESARFFDEQRSLYFPKERNYLQAHLTLFHHLPPQHFEQIHEEISLQSQQQETMLLEVSEVKMIGRGVAYKLHSEKLLQLHRHLQHTWQDWLIPQDKQKLWPHITVQNKVPPDLAKELHKALSAAFVPFNASGVGLQLWAYKGGPWELLEFVEFKQ
ncbi:2'-5' RNA ligase family protein [Pontibacter korlensis]|uniref:Phosphoesterase HXTX n=1 Tax=Pontibacter korlensis TaxID=400092 RepID=A0A0E3ZG41_9BACT|nr:2'-5' RNA ligase family protein [Pontibacter korlensis]AKD04734.1 hypothetical protein PKOR_18570 [Pontibacter korlensis]